MTCCLGAARSHSHGVRAIKPQNKGTNSALTTRVHAKSAPSAMESAEFSQGWALDFLKNDPLQGRLAEGSIVSEAQRSAPPAASVTSPPPPVHAGLLQADGETRSVFAASNWSREPKL